MEITHISWGEMVVSHNKVDKLFKDCRIWPEGAEEGDWKLTDTHHVPGIQPTDAQFLLGGYASNQNRRTP